MELLNYNFENILRKVLNTSFLGIIFVLLVWLVQYHWKRRKLYRSASGRNGPMCLPLIGNALYFAGSTTHFVRALQNLAKNYDSPVPVWIGNRLFFCVWDPNDLETLMNSPHALEKDSLYKLAGGSSGLLTADVTTWKRHRRIIAPTFNQKILNGFVEIFVRKSEVLVDELAQVSEKGVFDAFQFIGKCTLDMVCETAMGITTDLQRTECNFSTWIMKAMQISFTRMYTLWYHFDFIFNLTSLKKQEDYYREKIMGFTGTVIQQKKEAYMQKLKETKDQPEVELEDVFITRKTFLERLIELSEEDTKLSEEELLEEVHTFMIGGSDTTALTNSYTLVMLGMFPEIQQKVYEEVLDILGPSRKIEYTDLSKFTYLERVIKETMRVFPLGAILVRSVTEDIQLEKCTVPKGSSVSMLPLCLQRHPKYWSDPYKFDPDRFLPEEIAKRHPYSWLPFSGGPRNCIGSKYAMMAMKSLIATVVRKYEISTDYKNIEDITLKIEFVTKPVDGFRVAIKLRDQ